jgi:hypothetical protein
MATVKTLGKIWKVTERRRWFGDLRRAWEAVIFCLIEVGHHYHTPGRFSTSCHMKEPAAALKALTYCMTNLGNGMNLPIVIANYSILMVEAEPCYSRLGKVENAEEGRMRRLKSMTGESHNVPEQFLRIVSIAAYLYHSANP